MEAFISRYYSALFGIGMLGIIGISFYVGYLDGKSYAGSPVTLSCSDKTLSALTIPLEALAKGKETQSSSPLAASATPLDAVSPNKGQFLGSKNGTKYYTPGCSGAARIKPENIVWFPSAEDARLQGYSAAKC